ncbi:uncharacterized protein LOC122668578 [Telopea speciosissima]|uniref:uncharacterized protein LOC122668578 n=1 Tax=Telopea speciosissima TaxID=54955 RepID=UPI001CC564A5|nr:uncharacterized protein LOC122668578 [Telopea speciosissima]
MTSLGNGFVVFQVSSKNDMSQILRRSPVKFDSQRIRFQRWKPDFNIFDNYVATKLVWVRFPNLPFEYWHENVLLSKEKVVGHLVALDRQTRNDIMGHFARVQVEVEDLASVSRIYEFQVERKQPGSEVPFCFKQFVEYEDELRRSGYCKKVGHVLNACQLKKEDKAKAAHEHNCLGHLAVEEDYSRPPTTRVSGVDCRGGTRLTDSSRGALLAVEGSIQVAAGGEVSPGGGQASKLMGHHRLRLLKVVELILVYRFPIWGVKKVAGRRALSKFLKDVSPDIICLAELKVDVGKFLSLFFNKRGFTADVFANDHSDGCPNLWVIWKSHFQHPTVISSLDQQLSINLEWLGRQVSFVHAKCFGAKRRELWLDLVNLRLGLIPWCMVGDFNATLFSKEKRGLDRFNQGSIADFQAMIDSCSLIGAPSQGNLLTWSNNRRGNVVAVLDRGFFSQGLLTFFHDCAQQVLPRIASDHSPILVFSECVPLPVRNGFPNINMAVNTAETKLKEVQVTIEAEDMSDDLFNQEVDAKTALLKIWRGKILIQSLEKEDGEVPLVLHNDLLEYILREIVDVDNVFGEDPLYRENQESGVGP